MQSKTGGQILAMGILKLINVINKNLTKVGTGSIYKYYRRKNFYSTHTNYVTLYLFSFLLILFLKSKSYKTILKSTHLIL